MPYQSHPGSEEESVSGRSGKAQASPSLCPTIPQVVEGKQVLSGAKSYEPTLQETWCPASPVESWGIEGCNKDLPLSFQMWVLLWGDTSSQAQELGCCGPHLTACSTVCTPLCG